MQAALEDLDNIWLASPAKGLQLGCFLTDSCSFEAAGRAEYFIHGAPCALGALHVENINPIQTPFLFFLPTPTRRSYFGIKPSVSGLTVLSVLYYSSKVKKVMYFCPSEMEKNFFLQTADPVIISKYPGAQQCL